MAELIILGSMALVASVLNVNPNLPPKEEDKPLTNVYRIYYPDRRIASMAWEVYDQGAMEDIKSRLRCCTVVDNKVGAVNYGTLHPLEQIQVQTRFQMEPQPF